jgi:hypothetical protein
MALIRDTEREFQEPLRTSKEALNGEKKQELEEEDEDFDDFGDIEEDNYTAEDIAIVETALQILNCSFRFVKGLLDVMTLWGESPLLQADQILPSTPSSESALPLQHRMPSLYSLALSIKSHVVAIGVELYTTPVEIAKLKPQLNELLERFQQIFLELDQIERGGASEETNELRRNVTRDLRIGLQAIETEARLANASLS